MDHIASVFANAAIPQKLVLLAVLAAVPAILVGIVACIAGWALKPRSG